MKIDLELLRKAQKMRRKHIMFCDICGETDPPSHFYPLGIHGPDSIRGVICNDCHDTLGGQA